MKTGNISGSSPGYLFGKRKTETQIVQQTISEFKIIQYKTGTETNITWTESVTQDTTVVFSGKVKLKIFPAPADYYFIIIRKL